jgi:hypothetical protein
VKVGVAVGVHVGVEVSVIVGVAVGVSVSVAVGVTVIVGVSKTWMKPAWSMPKPADTLTPTPTWKTLS